MRGWWAAFVGLGLATVGVHHHLARAPHDNSDPYPMLAHFGVAFLVYLGGLMAARVLGGGRSGLAVLWCFLVSAASLWAYLPSPILLSEEVNRYRWDGMVAEAGYNPYEVYPDDPDLASLREGFGDTLPHPDRKGLYPPLAELFFYAMARFDTDTLFHYRAVFSIMALLCGLAMLPLCRAAGVPSTRVTVFLWHPLLILETAANAHMEALAVFFLLLSMSLLITRHQLTPMGSLALAALTRTYPLALLPMYIRRVPPYRIILFFLVLGLGAVPFIGAGRELLSGFFDYVGRARFNPGFFLLAEWTFESLGQPGWTRPAVTILGIGVAVALYFTDDGTNPSILRRAYYLAIPPILLAPVINPWYVIWLIPFLALVHKSNPLRMPFLFLSGSVILSYVYLDWGTVPGWVSGLEFGPVALLAAWGFWKARGKKTAAETKPEPALPAP